MNDVAQERAEMIMSENKFQGGDTAFGENLLITNSRIVRRWKCSRLFIDSDLWDSQSGKFQSFHRLKVPGELPVSLWYSEGKQYFQTGNCSPKTGLPSGLGRQHASWWWRWCWRRPWWHGDDSDDHNNGDTGNFCQVVWASSRLLGVGCARSPKTGKVLFPS